MSSLFSNESDFKFEELFFSRTDPRGIIQSGNSVFQRVSKYDWDNILLKPHNVIRHPAMPRGVFQLFWEMILSNQHIGAYVVNRAKDGSYYWVFAIVSPIENGFLSVRLKPSSPLFETVKQKYSDLLESEKSKKISPKESRSLLLEEIKKLNFRDYKHFMTEALTQEIEYRQKELGAKPILIISQLRDVLDLGNQLQVKCREIFSAYSLNALVPLNLEVQAARIGQEAAPIAVISSQYDGIAKQIQEETKKFVEAGNLVQEKVLDCQFDICNSLLQKEMLQFFKQETKETPVDKELEMSLLNKSEMEGLVKARASLSSIEVEFGKFKSVYEEVRKQTTALEIISITGKIEAVKIKQSSELMTLLDDLNTFKTTLKECLKSIDGIGSSLIGHIHQMKDKVGH